jgi:hypothetical protein
MSSPSGRDFDWRSQSDLSFCSLDWFDGSNGLNEQAVIISIDQEPAGIESQKKHLIPNIDKQRIEAGEDRHGEEGPVDQFSSRKSHAHIAQPAEA